MSRRIIRVLTSEAARFSVVFSIIYIPGAVAYFLLGHPYGGFVMASVTVPIIFLLRRALEVQRHIDFKLAQALGTLSEYSVYAKSLPFYRLVDLYKAVCTLETGPGGWIRLESQHAEDLATILSGQFYTPANRRVKVSESIARPIGPGDEIFVPTDAFWIMPRSPENGSHGAAVRLRIKAYTHEVVLEVAARTKVEAQQLIDFLLQSASDQSIYRNKMIEVLFEQEVRDELGDIERHESVDLLFKEDTGVTEHAIVLDEKVKALVRRNVLDFHQRRKQLIKLGVPGKKGVLFYGPPGTGKTYTCKYIAHELESATTIVATGRALLHVKSICSIARMLQPAVVILEDIDLVFSSREQNVYTATLGEFMDELDGFHEADQITFVMTTNAIDRVEGALRERPGRVSQCIYFGPPNPTLRRCYLDLLLTRYDCSAVDIDHLVSITQGVSQAFIKELVYRAVQIATESDQTKNEGVELADLHFDEALKEMRSAGERSDRIIGFRMKQ